MFNEKSSNSVIFFRSSKKIGRFAADNNRQKKYQKPKKVPKIPNVNFFYENIKCARRNPEQNALGGASWRPLFDGFMDVSNFWNWRPLFDGVVDGELQGVLVPSQPCVLDTSLMFWILVLCYGYQSYVVDSSLMVRILVLYVGYQSYVWVTRLMYWLLQLFIGYIYFDLGVTIVQQYCRYINVIF